MKFRMLTLLTLMALCSLPLLANAATYNWYFSDDAAGNAAGNDNTGNGSRTNPWKTLAMAQSQINSLGFGDIANLYFDRGDTWTEKTGQKAYHFIIKATGPIVNIDAYGSGKKPVFDGSITNFSTAPVGGSGYPAYQHYNRFFDIRRANCSISNIEIKNVYGNAIFLYSADGFTLSNSLIHNIGSDGTIPRFQNGIENAVIEYNEFHTNQQLYRYAKIPGWGAAINLTASGYGSDSLCKNNIVRYNLVYDIYGEGINAPNSTVEYNVVGDTGSVGINTAPQDFNALTTVVRYNFIIMSNWSTSIYDNMKGSNPEGIRVFDEKSGGDNSAANISIYGNIVINRNIGIWAFQLKDPGNPFGSVKIYNNTVIDCYTANFFIDNPQEFIAGYVYNNSSILYDRTGSKHANGTVISGTWDVDNNHFWTTGGSPNVPTAWRTNYRTGDPKLPGEPSVDWDGQKGATYFADIDLTSHLYPPSDSALVDAGKALGSNYKSMFLTIGTDFGALPDNARFQKISQNHDGAWDIGTTVRNFNGSSIPPPGELKILN